MDLYCIFIFRPTCRLGPTFIFRPTCTCRLGPILTVYLHVYLFIFRPRLGPILTKVLAAGGIYFVVAFIDGAIRASKVIACIIIM